MSDRVLIDSSAWTRALRRKGDATIRARVEKHLSDKTACWCDIVRVELWKGVAGERERQGLASLDQTLERLPMTDDVWNEACQIAMRTTKAGKPVPTTDILIFACAKVHGARIEHVDKHFDLLENLPA